MTMTAKTRRRLLLAVTAVLLIDAQLLAVAQAGRALATESLPAQTSTSHVRIALGSNRGTWTDFKAAIPEAKAVRVYYDAVNVFPDRWPDRAGPHVWTLLSIRPGPWDLLHGKLDAQLRTLIGSAPAHSDLTIWHENAVGNNPLGYPSSVHNPATYVRMQNHMERLVQGSRVRFGVIVCGPANQVSGWLAPGLDWYGYDFYDNSRYWNADGTLNRDKQWSRMTANLDTFRQVSGERYPPIRIGEANSPLDNHRKNWFRNIAQWFASHDGNRPAWLLSYWNSDHGKTAGGLSGPWPPSLPVIQELRSISWEY